MLISVMSRG